MYENTFKKLKLYYEDEYSICCFTNQSGKKRDIAIEKFKDIIELMQKDYGVPLNVCVATSNDKYRKPHTNMWYFLQDYYNYPIDFANSRCHKQLRMGIFRATRGPKKLFLT